MAGQGDGLIEITEAGAVRPLTDAAVLRLQSRAGRYEVLPAPSSLVILKKASDASGERECVLTGPVRGVGALCDIASFIGQTGWRGELIVEDAAASRSVFFAEGYVVGARSNLVDERLGAVLYRHGVLSDEQVRASGDAVADGGVRFGEAAVKLGFVTRERLFALMGRQTEEIFFGTMAAGDGHFYFLDGFEDAELSARQRLGVGALVREWIKRMHETRYFRARIPSANHVPVCVEGAAPPANAAVDVYGAIDGRRSLHEICRVVGAGEFEVTRALFQMVQAGCVAIRSPRLTPRAVVEVYNEAISLILRELDAIDQGDGVRAALLKFTDDAPVYATLFDGAGPADDGRFDAARVAQNVAIAQAGAAEAEDRLGECLYEYASYALFLARPPIERVAAPRPSGPRLSARVAAILEHIAPRGLRPDPRKVKE